MANVLTFMTGTAIAQMITVVISPILTRLFTPEAFGAFGVYMSLVSIATAAVTLRYDPEISAVLNDFSFKHCKSSQKRATFALFAESGQAARKGVVGRSWWSGQVSNASS